jgi:hypothetical protein
MFLFFVMEHSGMKPQRLIFVFLAIACLLIGLWTGLTRLGWDLPYLKSTVYHGSIMVGGFLGTLISLEKAIPLKKKIFLLIPILNASSIVFFLTGHFSYSLFINIAGSIGLCIIYLIYLSQQDELPILLMLLGAFFWLVGNSLILVKNFYPLAFPWWMAFLLFTVVAERLELSKFLPVTRTNKIALLISLGIFIMGILLPFHGSGSYLAGVSLILISIWLMRFDVIRVALKKTGLTYFNAVALLTGYIALLLTGLFMITFPATPFAYDAIVHTFFLGFIFSMIFAHGPIILPGVLGSSIKPFHPFLYFPLMLLALSVLIRVSADAYVIPYHFRMASGWISAASILLYFATILILLIRGKRNGALQ